MSVLKIDKNYVADEQGIYKEFVVDNIEDVALLPTGINDNSIDKPRPGSTALVCNAATVYVLNNAREWVVLTAEG